MTQEEKDLLLKDLCARLPYGVIVEHTCIPENNGYSCELTWFGLSLLEDDKWEVKPYLRPMSSMTEEEKIELCTISYAPDEMKTIDEKLYVIQTNAENAADFYNKHHFDYRGLIEKGLALEAPKEMYETNEINPQ